VLTGRRFRLELTAGQAEYAEIVGGACRSVWNTGLEQRRAYRRRGAWINYHEQARQLAEAKTEHEWLKDVPGQCLQQTLMDLDKACRTHGTFKVRWRSGRRWRPSFRFPEGGKIQVERLGRKAARCKLPKFGWVRFRWSRPVGGIVRSVTISRDGKHWYISFLVEDGKCTPDGHLKPGSATGIDRGVKTAVATSDGSLHDRQVATSGERQRHLRLQRKLARTRKGSANRRKIIARMGPVRARERARRKDFCAQIAHGLTRDNALIVLEDLKTRNMTASAKGTIEQPGTNVRQKAGLNRAILGKGWHAFELALSSAARTTGTKIVKVNPAYTSQRCSACTHVAPDNRESQAVFRCTACGHTDHADVNAARNILAAGLAVTACGDLGISRSVKQESAGTREVLPHQRARETLAGIPRL
jgi:putative transposase